MGDLANVAIEPLPLSARVDGAMNACIFATNYDFFGKSLPQRQPKSILQETGIPSSFAIEYQSILQKVKGSTFKVTADQFSEPSSIGRVRSSPSGSSGEEVRYNLDEISLKGTT